MERLKFAWIGINRAGMVCLLLLTGYLFKKEDIDILTLMICLLVWSNFVVLNLLVKRLFEKDKQVSDQSSIHNKQTETNNGQNESNEEEDKIDISEKESFFPEDNEILDDGSGKEDASKDEEPIEFEDILNDRKTEVRVSLNTEKLSQKCWGLGETDAVGYWRDGMGKFIIRDGEELIPRDLKVGTIVNDDINRIVKGQQIEKLFDLINMDRGEKIVSIKPAGIRVEGENIYLSEKGRVEAE